MHILHHRFCWLHDIQPKQPIPSALDAKTKELYVYYYGPNIDLVKDKVSHLKALTKIHLSGNFGTIKDDTFTDFPFLTNITIYNSSLARIEDYAFGSNSSLLNLNLSTSNLKYVPKNVFHSLPNVVTLDLSFSSHMTVCSPEIPSISEEFRYMVALRELRLDNLGTYNRSCRYISENYFKPIEQVASLVGIWFSLGKTNGTEVPQKSANPCYQWRKPLQEVSQYGQRSLFKPVWYITCFICQRLVDRLSNELHMCNTWRNPIRLENPS